MRSILSKDMALRRVEPEILDGLPADDPTAIAARLDLVHLNALMFQARIMAALLRRHVREPPSRILEIGAGDANFMLAVARRMASHWPKVDLVLLDRIDLIPPERRDDFEKLGWRVETVTADIFEWVGQTKTVGFDVITANLFLHHFDAAELTRLFSGLQLLAPVFVATEPCRAVFPLAATRLLWLIGAHAVTSHDSAASVRAGFTGTELSELWVAGQGKLLEERRGGLFTHVFAGASTAAVRPT